MRTRPGPACRVRTTITHPVDVPHSAPEPVSPELARQRALLDAWLQSDDALDTARRLLGRRGLNASPADLVNDAWLRITESIARRTEPYPELTEPRQAARFGARVLDNLSRDRLRSQARRREVELFDAFTDERSDPAATDTRMMLEQLLASVAVRAEEPEPCPGCPDEVVVAAALELVHLVLAGHDGGDRGRTWIDQMLYLALDRVDGGVKRSEAAASQRKARCGRCIDGLLRAAATDLVGAEP